MSKRLPVPTTGAQGGVVGRPRKNPPPEAAKQLEDMAAKGRGIAGCASALQVSRDTLRAWLQESPDLMEAFERGKEKERHELHLLIRQAAREGRPANVNAMFLLKTRHGYREGDPGEQSSRITVTVNMPAAQSKEEFLASVVAEQGGTHGK